METKKKESYMKMFEAFLDKIDEKDIVEFVSYSDKFIVEVRRYL